MEANSWYDAAYGDDPSTDNVFGREDRAERRNPLLHTFLQHGGRISDFTPRRRDPVALMALLDRILDATL
jgi:hypothetical protein